MLITPKPVPTAKKRVTAVSFAGVRSTLPKFLGHTSGMLPKDFDGRELARRRRSLGLTQPEVASAAHMSDETLRKIEKNRHASEVYVERAITALGQLEAALSGDTPEQTDPGFLSESDTSATVTVVEKGIGAASGQHVVTIKIAALGIEASSTYTDSEDRAQVIADLVREFGLGNVGDR